MDSQPDTPNNAPTQAGDLILLAGPRQKNFIFRLTPGERIQTHRGILQHDDLIGLPYGTQVFSHLKRAFVLLKPSLSDLLLETKRSTQIMYPKDVGFLLVTMGIGPGQHVLEAGTGSGALTTALAFAVGPQGRVTSYEVRPEMQRLAQKNLDRIGLADRVTFKLRNIQEGFDEQGVDALYLDVPNPYDYLAQARAALKSGGSFGTILPSTNQVVRLMNALYRERFAFVEVCEILLRYYQTHPERLRPVDRMVAHTGYLIFARPVLMEPDKLYEDSETEAEVDDVQLAGEILEDEAGGDLQVIEP
jgi:tRNA (adenine57-N1/adenine58-N1)-methyltransferase catalytic subunit